MPARPGPALSAAFKARYSATLQLGLVLACVVALAAAGLGVVALDVRPPAAPDARRIDGSAVAPAIRTGDAYVAPKPVAPKIREVAVRQAAPAPAAPAPAPVPQEPRLRQVAETAAEPVTGLATVGMTWAEDDTFAEDQIRLEVRTQQGATWSGWEKLEYHDDHGPDSAEAGEDAGRLRQGTEPTVVGRVDRVQVRTLTTTGRAPRDLQLVLIDPGADPVHKAKPAIDTASLRATKQVERKQAGQDGELSLSAMAVAPKPQIYSRAQWGADERIRDQSAPSYGTVQTGFVHHTVNANDYAAEDVPALLRGIYAYHVRGRGWRDIGYNYLVDRFGRIWEGRYGGVDKAVVGAHTLGYNEVSFAMSAIGNFDIAQPPPAVADAYARLFAWKLSLYGIAADATGLRVKGKVLNAINGHRDVGQTACPGRYLYAQLPAIRAGAAAIQRGQQPAPAPTPTPTPTSPATPKPTTPTPGVGPITPAPAGSLPARSSVLGGTWPDLVVRVRGSNQVQVVPTGGQFGFAGATATTLRTKRADIVLAPGDLTGDGAADLLVRSARSGAVSVHAVDAAGRIGKARARTTRLARFSWLAAVGDVNGDRRPDLAAGKGHKVYVVPGRGKARFAAPRLVSSSWTAGPAVGVGGARIAGANQRHRVVAARVFGKRLGKLVRSQVVVPPGGRLVGGADLTGDRRADLVVRAAKGQARVYPGAGRSWSTTPLGPFGALGGLARATTGTFAGRAGVVGRGAGGRLVFVAGNGRTNVGSPVGGGTSLPGAGQLLNIGDWNRDGRADLVWRPAGSKYLFFRAGDGAGGFGADVKMRAGMAKVPLLAAVGDVTGDGNPDLVGRTDAGEMIVYPGNGATGFLGAVRAPAALRAYNQIGSALWNASASGASLVSASGTFVPNAAGAALGSTYDWVIGAGDVDGDGVADLLVREAATGNLYLLPGTGSGFGARRFVAGGFGIYDLGG